MKRSRGMLTIFIPVILFVAKDYCLRLHPEGEIYRAPVDLIVFGAALVLIGLLVRRSEAVGEHGARLAGPEGQTIIGHEQLIGRGIALVGVIAAVAGILWMFQLLR